jgi:hypothetical protein
MNTQGRPLVALMPPTVPRTSNFVDVYANQVRISVSVSDIDMIFSVMQDRGSGIVALEDLASIRLSPITAKVLLHNLQMIVDAYEASVGSIDAPPKALKQIQNQQNGLMNALKEQMAPDQT